MFDAQFVLALTSGMLATINPCGFALLPAYLSFFVGAEDDDTDRDARRAVGRAAVVSGAVTVGFILTFTVIGLLAASARSTIQQRTPWITIVIGLGLVLLGGAMVAGFKLNIRLPQLTRGGRSRTRSLGSMVLFGVSYAIASIGCTIATFLIPAAGLLQRTDVLGGLRLFVAYALGMGLVLATLTIGLALTRHSLVRRLRQILPYVQRIAGGLLVLAGAYVAYYGWYELRVYRGDLSRDPIVDGVTRTFDDLRRWVISVGGLRLATALVVLIAAGVLAAMVSRRRDALGPPPASARSVRSGGDVSRHRGDAPRDAARSVGDHAR
ncbi:MAG: cytochrome c biogenesis CcdA family protein [Acidimicrobiales bacterium]